MAVLSDDIDAATRAARIEAWSDAAIQTRYPRARDGSKDPAQGFFDDAANAVTAIVARGALIGAERRRFKVVVNALIWPDPGTEGVPTVTLVDPEQGVSAPALVCRVEVDPESESTLYEVMA